MWASLPLASSPEHCLPHIQFLFIGSRLCSALLSGPASRRVLSHPCASLSLHVHHTVKRTCTSKLSIMLGTPKQNGASATRLPRLSDSPNEIAYAASCGCSARRCAGTLRRSQTRPHQLNIFSV